MRVLITNDDGVEAPGIAALARAVIARGWEAVVVAPASQASGASRSFQSNRRIGLSRRTGLYPCEVYITDSTPSACVLAALGGTVGGGFDLCLSGVNNGENLGAGLTISGTYGAAVEAAVRGIQAIAISVEYGTPPDDASHWDWQDVASRLESLLPAILSEQHRDWMLANVNLAWRGLHQPLVKTVVSIESYFSDVYHDATDQILSARNYPAERLGPADDIYWFAERHRNTISFFDHGPFSPLRIEEPNE